MIKNIKKKKQFIRNESINQKFRLNNTRKIN